MFDPCNPHKNYYPHNMLTDAKKFLTHVTHATHVKILPTQPMQPNAPI